MNCALNRFRRRFAPLSIMGCAVSLLLASNCSNSSSKKETSLLKLNIESLENGAGDEFEPDEEITVACDGHLTVHFGPDDDIPYLLDHWDLRPPGDCDDHPNCGFIELEVRAPSGKVERLERASLAIVLSPELVAFDELQLRARLIDGRNGAKYLSAGKPVETTAQVQLRHLECPTPGEGGAGGVGGAQGGSSADAGAPAMGGGGASG